MEVALKPAVTKSVSHVENESRAPLSSELKINIKPHPRDTDRKPPSREEIKVTSKPRPIEKVEPENKHQFTIK